MRGRFSLPLRRRQTRAPLSEPRQTSSERSDPQGPARIRHAPPKVRAPGALTLLLAATALVSLPSVATGKAKPVAKTIAPTGPTLPYTTTVVPTKNADLDSALTASSDLLSLQKTHAVGPFALAGRIRSEYARMTTALESFGYYDGHVTITAKRPKTAKAPPDMQMDGNDINLPQWLGNLPVGETLAIEVTAKPGPLYHLGSVKTVSADKKQPVTLSDAEKTAFGLKSGDPAVASNVLKAGDDLAGTLQEEGHPLANVDAPTAFLQPATQTLDVIYPVTIGPKANIGPITLKGLDKTKPAFIRRRLTVGTGQLYQPSKIENARQDLASLGIFSTVSAKDASKLAPDGAMPLTFSFAEAKRHSVGAEIGYSTDLGGRVGATWTHHNLFGNAERLRLTALITGLGGSAQQGLGYDVYADLFKPDFPGRNQNASFRLEGLKQDFYSYRQTALIARAGIVRRLNRHWNISYGLAAEQEKIEQFWVTKDYTMIFAPVSANFDNTDLASPLLPATRGWRVSLSATPSASFDQGTSFFALLQANASTYVDLARTGLTRPGRSVFAFRAIVGSVQGASTFNIPPDQRLYGGGTATIRGYRYQGVGPQFAGTKYAIGGTSLDAGTIEFRQRILKSFGAAGFVDAGQVGSGSAPLHGTLRVGAGAGARYFTPIGPVRLDIAVPLNRPPRGDKWELYIGLGETF
ncbi:autotransporter assembly complex protein TamA [Acetobacter fallax]|uniref:BamA/TamA family outer membrane protein n=1 Tax=Acetobacter fallax TaxID=1737473 RepID=A0ABX0KB15_9PROT|nr:BamA/TamA family outer membrane protein [Acetobacter fallax]NHO31695.1 BamA/TamA family outer membrane protein [Acetobacter fallax]NHO35254.1 BamA/TamA family outer membrane protein [Acetobacter fallax]